MPPVDGIDYDAIERIRARFENAYDCLTSSLLKRVEPRPSLTTEKNELEPYTLDFVYRLSVPETRKQAITDFFRYAHDDLRLLLQAFDHLRRVNAHLSVEQGQQ